MPTQPVHTRGLESTAALATLATTAPGSCAVFALSIRTRLQQAMMQAAQHARCTQALVGSLAAAPVRRVCVMLDGLALSAPVAPRSVVLV